MATDTDMAHAHHFHDHGGYGRGDYRNGTDLDTLILSNQIAAGNQNLSDKVSATGTAGMQETADAARDTVNAVRDGVNATNQIGNINLQATERNGGETRSAVEIAAGTIRDAMAVDSLNNARAQAILVGEICDVRKEASDIAGKTWLEMTKQHGQIQLEMCKQHAELARQIDAKAAEAARQLAECCCETKELVRAENAATRELIQHNALDECRRRESALQNDLNLLKFAQMTASNGPGNSRIQ